MAAYARNITSAKASTAQVFVWLETTQGVNPTVTARWANFVLQIGYFLGPETPWRLVSLILISRLTISACRNENWVKTAFQITNASTALPALTKYVKDTERFKTTNSLITPWPASQALFGSKRMKASAYQLQRLSTK